LHLKRLELVGFKSFADRTRLEFEPGMTAIVGPNGCGKSNVSDAIRWVLGEQSAKALRGGSMADVIFNGTQTQKAMGMAEVSLTVTDAEELLGTEFNEVTITRRVFKSGEGQYFINKAPCRLKDIQRLFMDTGIGTNAYSLMEQGRIDRILSSRPEDRRAVFEEASGITKFKADKKEAIRKLDHTEANLLRLADIIKEVKRQIISLQRQAGKARRYKDLQSKLRGHDIYTARERLQELEESIKLAENKLASVSERDETLRTDVNATEQQATALREELNQIEDQIAMAMESASQARSELDHTEQSIALNRERITELKTLSERDTKDAADSQSMLERHIETLKTLEMELEQAQTGKEQSEQELAVQSERLTKTDQVLEALRSEIDKLQTEAIDRENKHAHLQNELSELDVRERGTVIKRERLMAEKIDLQRSVENYAMREEEITQQLEVLKDEVEKQVEVEAQLRGKKHSQSSEATDLHRTVNELQKQLAGKQAQIEMIEKSMASDDPYPAGARLLMEPPEDFNVQRDLILGSLAEQIEAEPAYRSALEAVIRSWLDAIVVRDDSALLTLSDAVAKRAEGAVRLLAVHSTLAPAPAADEGAGQALINHVQTSDEIRPLVERLLSGVRVVKYTEEMPHPMRPEMTYVTLDGIVLRGDGSAEFWMPGDHESNPLTRRHLLAERTQECEELKRKITIQTETIQALEQESRTIDEAMAEARVNLEERRRALAICQGESQMVAREAKQAREKYETIEWELNALNEQEGTGEGRRDEIKTELETVRNRQAQIRATIQSNRDTLRTQEQERAEILSEVTECRIRFGETRHQVQHLVARQGPVQDQIHSLESLIRERAAGVDSYKTRIETLAATVEEAAARLDPIRELIITHDEALSTVRALREEKGKELQQCAVELHKQRQALDELQSIKSKLEVTLAEQRMINKNLLDRITEEYRISPEQIQAEAEPEWENGEIPDRETLETTIAELRTKLDSMGPVNLVAIEEHKELEERYHFLTQQQDDLVKAKQQLMDMIKKINNTTTEMFSDTFNKVNDHFQVMFKRLFGGGSAKLVLVNEEDVLESGIEIIARPPGKKLTSVSLLSGGERTLTAVALLFSLYMVKPSPFCVLDELDAALDDSNIGRFVTTVQSFIKRSQFVVITHNRQTISAADVLYGVTMEKHGISKIVSVKFSDHETADHVDDKEPISVADSVRGEVAG